MIVDGSAVVAILNRESDAEYYETEIASAPECRMSIANALETTIVIDSCGHRRSVQTTLGRQASRSALDLP